MNFTELDGTTREWMLRRFEAEESGGNPYRSEALSQPGLADWPDLMRQAITDPDGNEVTLAARLNRPGYWQATETYVRNGVSHQRRVNAAQASERLAVTEFNTWYVAGLATHDHAPRRPPRPALRLTDGRPPARCSADRPRKHRQIARSAACALVDARRCGS
jgi:hypothetical protein